jgi:hypothetical protein
MKRCINWKSTNFFYKFEWPKMHSLSRTIAMNLLKYFISMYYNSETFSESGINKDLEVNGRKILFLVNLSWNACAYVELCGCYVWIQWHCTVWSNLMGQSSVPHVTVPAVSTWCGFLNPWWCWAYNRHSLNWPEWYGVCCSALFRTVCTESD